MNRLWTTAFVLISAGSLFLFTGFYLLLPTLPLFIKDLGGLDAQVGLAAGVFTFAAVVARPLAGGLLDRYGRRPFLLAGLALFALSMYAYGWVRSEEHTSELQSREKFVFRLLIENI